MVQIIGWILCFYLAIKGVEIFQIALCSSRENRKSGLTIGAIAMVICFAASILFVNILSMQASSGPGLR